MSSSKRIRSARICAADAYARKAGLLIDRTRRHVNGGPSKPAQATPAPSNTVTAAPSQPLPALHAVAAACAAACQGGAV